jgi:MYXO-CTERM domain-containing protein
VSLPISLTEGFDINDGEGVLRFPVSVPAGGVTGFGAIVVELGPAKTEFVDDRGELIPFVAESGSFTICPEPSSAALYLLAATLPAFRRRRRP